VENGNAAFSKGFRPLPDKTDFRMLEAAQKFFNDCTKMGGKMQEAL